MRADKAFAVQSWLPCLLQVDGCGQRLRALCCRRQLPYVSQVCMPIQHYVGSRPHEGGAFVTCDEIVD